MFLSAIMVGVEFTFPQAFESESEKAMARGLIYDHTIPCLAIQSYIPPLHFCNHFSK